MPLLTKILFALGLISLFACQNTKQNSPEETIRGFVEALKKEDFDQAKRYATQETAKNYINIIKTGMSMQQIQSDFLKDSLLWSMQSINCQTQENSAICLVCCKKEKTDTIQVIKEDNLWKINILKELKIFE